MNQMKVLFFFLSLKCLNYQDYILAFNENISTYERESIKSIITLRSDFNSLETALNIINDYRFNPPLSCHPFIEDNPDHIVEDRPYNVIFFSITFITEEASLTDCEDNILDTLNYCKKTLGKEKTQHFFRIFEKNTITKTSIQNPSLCLFQLDYDFYYTESSNVNDEIKKAWEQIKLVLRPENLQDINISITVSSFKNTSRFHSLLFPITLNELVILIFSDLRETLQIMNIFQNIYKSNYGQTASIYQNSEFMANVFESQLVNLSPLAPMYEDFNIYWNIYFRLDFFS